VLACLYERAGNGLTAAEARDLLGVKINSAAIALARLLAEGWCTARDEERHGRPGRPCKRYTIKGDA
jgi:predicted transcriptional regulator